MDWPDREIQAPFSYLQRMELGPMTSGSLVTLKALLSQRGFFYQQHTLPGSTRRRGLSLRAQRSNLDSHVVPLLAMTPCNSVFDSLLATIPSSVLSPIPSSVLSFPAWLGKSGPHGF